MTRANIQNGVFAGIVVGSDDLAGASEFTASGITANLVDANEFGYAANKSVPDGTYDLGTISVPNVLQDPANAAHLALVAACKAGTEYTTDQIKFKRTATSYWTPGTGGTVVCTKAPPACLGGMKRSGLVPVSYEFKISGADLELKPSLVSIAVTATGGAATVAVGATKQMIATGTYSSGDPQVITSQVAWASADETKIVVTESGLTAGVAADAGTDITATFLGIVGTLSMATTGP